MTAVRYWTKSKLLSIRPEADVWHDSGCIYQIWPQWGTKHKSKTLKDQISFILFINISPFNLSSPQSAFVKHFEFPLCIKCMIQINLPSLYFESNQTVFYLFVCFQCSSKANNKWLGPFFSFLTTLWALAPSAFTASQPSMAAASFTNGCWTSLGLCSTLHLLRAFGSQQGGSKIASLNQTWCLHLGWTPLYHGAS